MNISEWNNTSPFESRRKAAADAFKASADRAKAVRDSAISDAARYEQVERGKRERAAVAAFDASMAAALDSARVEFDSIAEGIEKGVKKAASKAPTSEQVNYLSVFRIKGTATNEEVEAAFEAMRGNLVSVSALASVIEGGEVKDANGMKLGRPFKTYDASTAGNDAREALSRWVGYFQEYAGGNMLTLNTGAYDPVWTPLCYWLEACGVK